MSEIVTTVPQGHTGPVVYLLNFPAAHTPSRRYAVTLITDAELRDIVNGDRPVVSAVGHQGAADAFAGLLGQPVPASRIEVHFNPGDIAVCCRLRRRQPEGAVLDAATMAEIGYDLVRVDVMLGDLEAEIADRWVAAMRAMGADELRGPVWEGRHCGVGVSAGDSALLVALGPCGPMGSISAETDECPLRAGLVSWRAVCDAWTAAGGRVMPPGPWTPRAGERVRGCLDGGDTVTGTALDVRSAFGQLGREISHVWEGSEEIVILPDNHRDFARLVRFSGLRPCGQ